MHLAEHVSAVAVLSSIVKSNLRQSIIAQLPSFTEALQKAK
jgi:hypothetical protein